MRIEMKLGEYQKLKVIKKVEFGIYLAEHEGDETRVLLPQKQVPADAKLGDEIEVFLYKGFQGPHHCDDQPAETDAWRTGGA